MVRSLESLPDFHFDYIENRSLIQKRHKRDRPPEVRILLKKGDIFYPIPSSDGHPIGEDEIRSIPENATVKRNGKMLTVPDLMVAYKAYIEEQHYE